MEPSWRTPRRLVVDETSDGLVVQVAGEEVEAEGEVAVRDLVFPQEAGGRAPRVVVTRLGLGQEQPAVVGRHVQRGSPSSTTANSVCQAVVEARSSRAVGAFELASRLVLDGAGRRGDLVLICCRLMRR